MTLVEMALRYGLKSADGLRRQAIRGTLKASKVGTGRHAVWVVREEDAQQYAHDHLGKPGFSSATHPFHGQRPPRKGEGEKKKPTYGNDDSNSAPEPPGGKSDPE